MTNKFLSISLFLSICSPSYAQENSQLKSIYAREQSVNQLSSALFRFDAERQSLLSEDKGLPVDLKTYSKMLAVWINGYDQLVSDIGGITDLNVMQNLIHTSIRNLSTTRAELRKASTDIRTKVNYSMIVLRIDQNMGTSDELQSQHDSILSASQAFQNNLTKFIQTLDQNDKRIDEISTAFSADFFYLRYFKVAIDKGLNTYDPKLQKFREYIDAEKFAEGIYSYLDQKTIQASITMVQLRGIELAKIMPELASICAQSMSKIDQSSLSDEQKQRLNQDISGQCKKVQSDYETTILVYKPEVLAKAMHKQYLRKFRSSCTYSGRRCDAYRRLQNISENSIGSMSLESIAYLEDLWLQFQSIPYTRG